MDYNYATVFRYPDEHGLWFMLVTCYWHWYDRRPEGIVLNSGYNLGPNANDIRLLVSTDGEQFGIATLSMLKAGVELLDAGVPFDELIHLAVRHADHVESVAKDAVALFAKHLDETSTSSQTQLVEDIVPLVTELVAQHFRQTLIEQVGRHLLDGGDSE